uniref:RING-type domain-containing protein n=1 Tax=Macrostomum lignano TaxID=282301 RepID=A0A1I8IBL4_9PLAT
DRFDSLGAAPVSAATWWLFRLGELPQQAGTEPSLPLLTVKMMPNCSGLTVKPLKSTAGIGDYAVLADASGCSIVRVLTLLPKLLSNTRGRCLLYGIQGANSVGDVESGDAADMCILIQEHGYSNRRSLFGELRADNRTCSAAASASVGNGDSFINRVSVVFVSVSFVLLVAISVSWIVFYYVQRFRYRHAKKRLSELQWIGDHCAVCIEPYGCGDPELQWIGDHCAVCIEPYGCGDPVRILPC